jgi:hypothetical protein
MPSLAQHQSNRFVKLLLLGDAKSGKTGSLVSLVAAGYKLRILDFDNLLDILSKLILQQCPERIENVEYRTLRDRRKAGSTGPIIDGSPTAFVQGLRMLDRWKYKASDGTEIDLGVPASWGPECILVLDSLSRFCDAAYVFREPLAVRGKGGEFDARAVYGDAQDSVESTLAMLTSDTFETNVIVVAHGQYMDLPDGTKKIFPQGVGQKLSPKIPQYFPNYVRYKNLAGKRTIQLRSDAMIDLALANPLAKDEDKSLPVETGLATLFEMLRGPLTEEDRNYDRSNGHASSESTAESRPEPSTTDSRPAPSTSKFQPLTKFRGR